jgi:predicted ArsR family transcriptional regulator
MKPTRTLILDYLEIHRVAIASEISRALKVTPADIRHHLNLLKQEGLVETCGLRKASGRGRPSRLFRLSQQKLGENLGILASALLDEIQEQLPENQQSMALHRIARRIRGGVSIPGNLSQRLVQATRRLNELNYQARWEAHPEAPQVIFEHCPYAAILEKHPEICSLDSYLLEDLLVTPVSQLAKLAKDTRGATYCKFRVHERKTSNL